MVSNIADDKGPVNAFDNNSFCATAGSILDRKPDLHADDKNDNKTSHHDGTSMDKGLVGRHTDRTMIDSSEARANLVKKPTRSFAYRYPVLMNIKTRSMDPTTIQQMPADRALLLPKLWFSEASLLRILFGANLRCDCADAERHVMPEKQLFDEHRNRVSMLDLFGTVQFHVLLVEARRKNLSYVRHNHMFLDEYAAVCQTLAAMRLCCNSHRFDQCWQFSRWLFQTIQKTKETYRSRIFVERETQLRKQTTDNRRVIASLEAQLIVSEKRLEHVQQMYENALRCLRPNKNVKIDLEAFSQRDAASTSAYIPMCFASSKPVNHHQYTNTTKPIV